MAARRLQKRYGSAVNDKRLFQACKDCAYNEHQKATNMLIDAIDPANFGYQSNYE